MSTIKVNTIQDTGTNNAMAISGGTVTFSNAPSGLGNSSAIVKILDETISSTGMYILNSTYINSTYDSYIIQIETIPSNDTNYFYSDAYVGGSVVDSGNGYSRYVREIGSGDVWNSPGQSEFCLFNRNGVGNATGEGITVNALLQNVNSTTRPAFITGMSGYWDTGGVFRAANFGGGFPATSASSVVNGINFYYSVSSTTFTGSIKLYGVQ